jgi:hypothetical protein
VFSEIKLRRIYKKSVLISILFVGIPLILSAYTHLWNPIGFPGIHLDEGTYMRRALHFMMYLDPQGSQGSGAYYDHPFFGQFFLAGVLSLLGYPDSLHPSPDVQSMEMLLLVPRLLMGLLAVADTFLIYKIAERRYDNRMIGFIAGILFAVMPVTWFYRRIYLDNILLPFLLSSMLCAIYLRKPGSFTWHRNDYGSYQKEKVDNGDNSVYNANTEIVTTRTSKITAARTSVLSKRNLVIIILSGVLLGLAIFTKLPAISFIPLVGFLVFTYTGRSFRALGLWFIPVIIIPLIWPAFAILNDDFDQWLNTVFRQASRESSGVIASITEVLRIDPVLFAIAFIGYVYGALKRDSMLLLWLIPFLALFTFVVHYINWFHWIPIIPAFSIAAAVMIVDVSSRVINKTIVRKVLPLAVISAIGIFGLISTMMLITTNLTSFQFQTAAFVAQRLLEASNSQSSYDQTTVISSQIYSWIFRYVFGEDSTFSSFRAGDHIETGKVTLLVDNNFIDFMDQNLPPGYNLKKVQRLQNLYNNSNALTSFEGRTQEYDRNSYPYYSMKYNFGGTRVQIREAVGYNDQLQTFVPECSSQQTTPFTNFKQLPSLQNTC